MTEFFKLAFLFTAFGCLFEVFFTSLCDRFIEILTKKKVDYRMFGYWSVLYIFPYGIVMPLMWIYITIPYVYELHWALRILIYGTGFNIGEYTTMLILKKIFGQSPPEANYAVKPDSIHNLTRLGYFPLFVIEAFCFEWLHKFFM